MTNLGDQKVTVTAAHNKGEWRVRTILITPSDGSDFYTIVVGQDLQDTESTIARYVLIFFGFALAVVIFGAATTQLLVTSTFAPLREVEATAARFAAGDYSQRLGGATPNTEVGRLNRSLNAMLARIDRAFADRERTVEQMRRFVGDASHELRTPWYRSAAMPSCTGWAPCRTRRTSPRRWTASSARRSGWAVSSRICSSWRGWTRRNRSTWHPSTCCRSRRTPRSMRRHPPRNEP